MSERPEVHSQSQLKRYHADHVSLAYFFHVVWCVGMLVAPFFIAYSTGDLWTKSEFYYEQPTVQFAHRAVVVGYLSDSDYIAWSTLPEYNALVDNSHLRVPIVKSSATDFDLDGKADEITVSVKLPLKTGEEIQHLEVLLFWNVQLLEKVTLIMEGLTRVTATSSLAGSSMSAVGNLIFSSETALDMRDIHDEYATSVLVSENLKSVSDTSIQSILTNELYRNQSLSFDGPGVVWTPGAGNSFTATITARVPSQAIRYLPNALETLKWAWIQYLAIAVFIGYPAWKLRCFIFENQLVQTLEQLDCDVRQSIASKPHQF